MCGQPIPPAMRSPPPLVERYFHIKSSFYLDNYRCEDNNDSYSVDWGGFKRRLTIPRLADSIQ
jgi:hypothetical protein